MHRGTKLILHKILTVAGLLLFSLSLFGQCYELVWSDEFESTAYPNSSYWTPEIGGGGFGNNEVQYYTANEENAFVENGVLTITAREEAYGNREYTSARLISKNKINVKYGKIEARIKAPYGQGIWPAFWMLGENISEQGWPACGEIDILEMIGGGEGRDDKVHGTIHWDNNGHASSGGSKQLSAGILADEFHTYSIEWTSKLIRWYLDGIQYFAADISPENTSEFHENFFLILNLAVGGNWPGYPDATTVFPQTLTVDYVRIYKKSANISQYEILGDSVLPQNGASEKYSLPEIPNVSYTWSVPEGTSIKSGQGSNEIILDWGCQDGNIECEISGACETYQYSISVSTQTEIIGQHLIEENEQDVMFYMPSLHNTTYKWTVPDDASIVSGINNDSLIVNWGSTFTNVSLDLSNNCGTNTIFFETVKQGQYPYPDMMNAHQIPGSIESVDFDLGGEGLAYHDGTKGNSGEGPRQDTDVDTEYKDNGNPNIASITSREYLEYSIDVKKSAEYKIDIRLATDLSEAGPLSIYINDKLVLSEIKIADTGGWDQFESITAGTIKLNPSDTLLKVLFNVGGLSFGKMTFTQIGDPVSSFSMQQKTMLIYPVPASKQITLSGLTKSSIIEIFDVNGRIHASYENFSQTEIDIDINKYTNGIYFLKVLSNKEDVWIEKFIKW